MKYKQVRKYYGRGRRGYYRVKPQITVSTKDAKCMVGLALLPLAFLASCAKVEPKKQKEKIEIRDAIFLIIVFAAIIVRWFYCLTL